MPAQSEKVRVSQSLPAGFEDLEFFAKSWALPTEAERNRKRLSSSMEEIRALYEAMLPRLESIMEYLNRFPLDDMPEEATRLLQLSFSFAEIATAVELFKQPSVVDGFNPARFIRVDVPHMTPRLRFEQSQPAARPPAEEAA